MSMNEGYQLSGSEIKLTEPTGWKSASVLNGWQTASAFIYLNHLLQ